MFGTPSAGLDLRLPGQWSQADTGGLFQNLNRDYDPSLGRYVEADPVGIEGGQNVYAYVDGRPTQATDPEGLQPIIIPAPRGPSPPGVVPGPFAPWNTSWQDVKAALGLNNSRAANAYCPRPGGNCPPCTPYAAGTIGYLGPHDTHDHFPVGRPHLNLFSVNQNPLTCRCRWNKANPPVVAPPPRPGWVDLNHGFPPLSP